MLELAKKPEPKKGKMILIYGAEGQGKTTIASNFPKPFFIRTEDGTESIQHKDFATLDLVKTKEDLLAQLNAIATEEHQFETVVIDTITSLNTIFEKEICKESKVTNMALAMGGYGKGYIELEAKHRGLVQYLRSIANARGLNIVLLGHSDVIKHSPPDQEAYTSYTLRMHEKSRNPYLEEPDCVGFIRQRTMVKDTGKAVSLGSYELICYPSPVHLSKNRWGINEPIPVDKDTNPLAQYLTTKGK